MGRSAVNYLFIAVTILALTSSVELFITERCQLVDNKCHVQQANNMLRSFANGIPQLGMPSLEPLKIQTVSIPKVIENANLYMTSVELHNFTAGHICQVKGFTAEHHQPMHITVKKHTDQMTIKSHYKTNGTIYSIKLEAEGELEWILRNVNCTVNFTLTPMDRNDKPYMFVSDLEISSQVESITMNMTNLTIPELMELYHHHLNMQAKIIFELVQPHVGKAVSAELKAVLNKMLSIIPCDQFFLPEKATVNAN